MDKNANRKIGAAGVMKVKAELLLKGFDVAEPDVDCGVDLIAWDHRSINRIQVKATVQKYSAGYSSFHTSKLVHKCSKSRASYDPREVDFIVCVSIPLNEYWIIPAAEATAKRKTGVRVGDKYHNKWFYLSKCNRIIGGDKYKSIREVTYKSEELEKRLIETERMLEISKLKEQISEHQLGNFYRYFKHRMDCKSIERIERYGTELDENEWDTMFGSDKLFTERNYSQLTKLYESLHKIENNPAHGTQGDPAAGSSVCRPLETKPDVFIST